MLKFVIELVKYPVKMLQFKMSRLIFMTVIFFTNVLSKILAPLRITLNEDIFIRNIRFITCGPADLQKLPIQKQFD